MGCVIDAFKTIPSKLIDSDSQTANCKASDTTTQLCTSNSGTICPYNINFGLSALYNKPFQMHLNLEVCVPNSCIIEDVLAYQTELNTRFKTILDCNSAIGCESPTYQLSCPQVGIKPDIKPNIALIITIIVITLLVLGCVVGTVWYVYKQKKEKPETPISEVLADMPPMRVTSDFFSKQKIEDKNFQEFWKEKNKELEEKDQVDFINYKERCKGLQDYHRKQAEQKQIKLEAEIVKEFDDALKMKVAIEEEDKTFKSYAEKCLMEWDTDGKNLKPLLRELQQYKKKTQ